MIVRTTYKANDKGEGKILAVGGGKQRTVPYDHSRSAAANHGAAASHLLVSAHNWDQNGEMWGRHIVSHADNGNGRHTFSLTYKV